MNVAVDLEAIRSAVRSGRIRWRRHALERMLERGILRDHVRTVILDGEMIEEYASTDPYPSGLCHGVVAGRSLHVVVAWDGSDPGLAYIVTAYEPDEVHFEPDLKTRRRKADG
jgi:hypothetical protein